MAMRKGAALATAGRSSCRLEVSPCALVATATSRRREPARSARTRPSSARLAGASRERAPARVASRAPAKLAPCPLTLTLAFTAPS